MLEQDKSHEKVLRVSGNTQQEEPSPTNWIVRSYEFLKNGILKTRKATITLQLALISLIIFGLILVLLLTSLVLGIVIAGIILFLLAVAFISVLHSRQATDNLAEIVKVARGGTPRHQNDNQPCVEFRLLGLRLFALYWRFGKDQNPKITDSGSTSSDK